MKEIKKRVISRKSEIGFAEIFYLSPEMGELDENGIQEMKLAGKRKALQLETFQVQSKISKEQIADLSHLHGLDLKVSDMMQSVLENELDMQTEKLIKNIMKFAGENSFMIGFNKMQDLFHRWFGYIPKVRINEEQDIPRRLMLYSNLIASRCRIGPANFVIISGGLASRIMDTPQFVYNDPNQPSLDQATGFVYKVGMLGTALEVLVDPNMKYDDMTVIIGRNSQETQEGIFYICMEPEIIKTDIVDEITLMPSNLTVLRKRQIVHPTENAHLQYVTFEFTDKPHNIFTHLWAKIQMFFK
jgi:hypothetical protein